jgi:UDP-glucuronate decarboxylase
MSKQKSTKHNPVAVVLGGAGFVGSHLCEQLIKSDYNVICIDNFTTSGQNNITHLLRLPQFKFINHDIVEPINLDVLPELADLQIKVFGIDEVYNLACPRSVKHFKQLSYETAIANSFGTKYALDLAKEYEAKYLHFSSHVVYGKFKEGEYVSEDFILGHKNQLDPRASLDEGKRYAETLVDVYREKFGLDTKIARVFRSFGPRMMLNDGQMIPDFIINALEDKEIVIHSNEDFELSLIYVSDVVAGAMQLMQSDLHGPYNIGQPAVHKIVDVAEKIIELTSSKSKLTFGKRLAYLREGAFPNINRIRDELGWFPLVTLEDGLKKTIKYMEAHKDLLLFHHDV